MSPTDPLAPPPAPSFPRTTEDLEREITTLSAHIGAAEYRLLRAIGEFDARAGWAGIGIASCAHWMNWKCGVSLAAGYEKVRVARALRELPATSAAMSRGELSYSKVRAITRVATAANESALVNLARKGTAYHLEQTLRRYRKLQRMEETRDAAARQRKREVRYRWDDDGTLVLQARLPPEQGALVLKALEAAAQALRSAERGPNSSAEESAGHQVANSSAEESRAAAVLTHAPFRADESFAARRADGLALMAETLLAHGAEGLTPGERHQVVVHVDAAVLADASRDGRAEVEHGPALAVETVRRLLCDGSLVPIADDADGDPLDVGRKTRAIPPALRRALKSRDGGCRFPGCTNHQWTDGHHIRHWADGGETKLDNLVLVCSVHHRLVHEEGFQVACDAGGNMIFRTPSGSRIDDAGANAYPVLAADPVLALVQANLALGITSRTCVPEWLGERPDYGWMVGAIARRDPPGTAGWSRNRDQDSGS